MSKPLSKPMRKSRKLRITCGIGEAWYYIGPTGLEVCVANEPGKGASNLFTISAAKIRRALAIIETPPEAPEEK